MTTSNCIIFGIYFTLILKCNLMMSIKMSFLISEPTLIYKDKIMIVTMMSQLYPEKDLVTEVQVSSHRFITSITSVGAWPGYWPHTSTARLPATLSPRQTLIHLPGQVHMSVKCHMSGQIYVCQDKTTCLSSVTCQDRCTCVSRKYYMSVKCHMSRQM